MKAFPFEQHIGLEVFFSNPLGIQGKLRTVPEDFIVKELFSYPKKEQQGPYTIAEVTSKNWETHTLVRTLAKYLKISRKRIGFAGTKDRRACSTQLMSFFQTSKESLEAVSIKDVEIKNIYYAKKSIRIGELQGNTFVIQLRALDPAVTKSQITTLLSSFEQLQGFPNFYGIQRFGVVRPITHLVGKYIIHGQFEQAVMTYIAHPLKDDKQTYDIRKELEKTRDYKQALKEFPIGCNFEKALCNYLVQYPDDFIGALQELPKNLLTLFVNAYQSYLFNKILSERIRKKFPIHQALQGDIITPLQNVSTTADFVAVTRHNIEKINTQLQRNKAVITGLLVGSNPLFAEGEMGELERRIIKSEQVDYRDFTIPEIPYLSSYGSRRSLVASLRQFSWNLANDDMKEHFQKLELNFTLPKGSYATSFLREIMKAKQATHY